ncbi:MAG: radical SAM family heme chaperone HemW [Flavobacteriales bacterium]
MAGIYLHIPFCRKACNYCDFYFSVNLQNADALVDAICVEILLRKEELKDQTIETIYFGGGTPSLLHYAQLQKIFNELHSHFLVSPLAEITMEANPDDLTLAKLKEIKALGFNRLSIGIQSFVDEHLIWMNRAHTSSEAVSSVKQAQDIGISNISIDLIYGFPMLHNNQWLNNLKLTESMGIKHLSSYSLTVEEGTKLALDIQKGKTANTNEDQSAINMQMLMDFAEQTGFEHYEISNFCKPGFESKHNSSYWDYKPYLGLGPSAHSFTNRIRKHNIRNLKKYIQNCNARLVSYKSEELTSTQQFNEFVITALRKRSGLDLSAIELHFGMEMMRYLEQAIDSPQLKELLNRSNQHSISLSRKGMMLADYVMLQLIKCP